MRKALFVYFGSSFFLHFLWENLQAPLYAGYTSFSQHFWICLTATATGDMIFMVLIYLALALLHKDIRWVQNRPAYASSATWILAVLIGVLLAVSFEWWAVFVAHRWVYGIMPLVPVLHVGLTPVLQMIAVPVVTLFLCSRFTSS